MICNPNLCSSARCVRRAVCQEILSLKGCCCLACVVSPLYPPRATTTGTTAMEGSGDIPPKLGAPPKEAQVALPYNPTPDERTSPFPDLVGKQRALAASAINLTGPLIGLPLEDQREAFAQSKSRATFANSEGTVLPLGTSRGLGAKERARIVWQAAKTPLPRQSLDGQNLHKANTFLKDVRALCLP